MELKSTQFDMTDPFARPTRLAGEAERRILAMPAARRQQIFAEYLSPAATTEVQWVEMPVQTRPFPVETWRPAHVAPLSQPTVTYRPRRIRRPLSRQEWLRLVAMRPACRLMRLARRQLRQAAKRTRRLMRHTLPPIQY
jgi:hypothetical protein